MKSTTKRKKVALLKSRHNYRPNSLRQQGAYIVLYTGVNRKLAKLVHTEAAIHNKSVSAMLADILSNRYANVR